MQRAPSELIPEKTKGVVGLGALFRQSPTNSSGAGTGKQAADSPSLPTNSYQAVSHLPAPPYLQASCKSA